MPPEGDGPGWHDMRVPNAVAPAARRRRAWVLAGLLALLLLVPLSGCTRIRTALAIQSNDTVAGDVVIAKAGGPDPPLTVPAALADRVRTTPYHQDGYSGATLEFTDLTFAEFNSLVTVAPQGKGRFTATLRRTGNLVVLSGQVDLTAMPVDQADVQLKVAFPGQLTSSNGQLDGNQVGWVFSPGEVDEYNAVINTPDPAAPSITRWLLLVGTVVLATSIGVVLMARAQRNPPSRLSASREP
jgi:phosphatidylinositol mannoside-binding LppM-like protein